MKRNKAEKIYYSHFTVIFGHRGVVGTATRYGLDGPGIESR